MLKTFVSLTVILCFLVLTQPTSASIGKSLVAHWTFDEGKGDTIKDSASRINGKIEGKVSWIEGKHGTALKFDDNGTGIIKVDIDPKLNFGDDFSVVFWAKTTQVRAKNADWWMGGWIINKDLGGQEDVNDWDIANVNGHLVLITGNPETDKDDLLVSTDPIADGKWHHYALSRVKESGLNTIYVDGVKNISEEKGPGFHVSNQTAMTIGGHPGGTGSAFHGDLDDMAIFSRVITEDEINTIIKGWAKSTAVERNGKLTIMWGQLKTNL